tara:strand:- start:149 stop:472 length:324 start_codon:yes stop_codon:yes gene_type:complete
MPKASGKYSQAISDRSGMQFPYKEMRKEWNGSMVHKSEFEPKHPQLDKEKHAADGQSIEDARPDRLEPITVFVGGSGFFEYNNSMQVSKKKPPLISSNLGRVIVSTS